MEERGAISIELVERENNKIADTISKIASFIVQRRAVNEVRCSLKNAALQKVNEGDIMKKYKGLKNKQKRADILYRSSCFAFTLNLLMGSLPGCPCPPIYRIILLHEVLQEVKKSSDAIALAAVGQALYLEAARMPRTCCSSSNTLNYDNNMSSNSINQQTIIDWESFRNIMKKDGVLFQSQSMR